MVMASQTAAEKRTAALNPAQRSACMNFVVLPGEPYEFFPDVRYRRRLRSFSRSSRRSVSPLGGVATTFETGFRWCYAEDGPRFECVAIFRDRLTMSQYPEAGWIVQRQRV